MENQNSDNVTFEKGLRTLLRASYHPVEPCPEFKKKVFNNLRESQRLLVAKKAKQRKIRYAIFSFAASAAAVAVLTVGVFLNEGQQVSPEINLASAAGVNTSTLVSKSFANVEGAMQISEKEDIVDLRTTDSQGGVELAPGVHLVMDKSSHVSIKDGHLDIDKGLFSLRVKDSAEAFALRLKDHTISLHPGSWLAMDVKGTDRYAPGGAPAPDITLFAGKATVANPNGSSELQPKRTYRLHLYQSLEDMEGDSLKDSGDVMAQPTLVNFKILK
ncbi:MAG: hypothetical protein ACYTFY_20495 [Planctomycetota bacterium]